MEGHDLPRAVTEQLVLEHWDQGQRAVEFLATARELLVSRPVAPRVGQTVAYCLREALASLAPAGTLEGGDRWRKVSRRVVDAKTRYERSRELPETAFDAPGALAEVLQAIDDLRSFHESDRSRRRSLVDSIVRRTGSQPHPAGERAVEEFLDVLDAASDAVHAGVEVDEPEVLYDRAIAVLMRLYQPAQFRFEELQALASLEEPGERDIARLEELILSPTHLGRFLRALPTTRWLKVLTDSGMLEPPVDGGVWPGFAAVDALVSSDPTGLAAWLGRLYDRCSGNETQLWHIMRAAHDIGEPADPLVRRVLARHVGKRTVRDLALLIALRRAADDAIVQDVADHLLNDHSDELWDVQEIAKRVVAGINGENGMGRLRLLTQKLGAPVGERDRWQWMTLDRGGSIADRSIDAASTRVEVLIAAVVQAAGAVHATAGIDALNDELEQLPTELGDRIRSWLLATDPATEPAAMAAQLSASMSIRSPSADDLTLLDRVVAVLSPERYLPGWTQALGPAPTDEEIAQMIAGERFEPGWARAYQWLGLLPVGARGPWAGPYEALCAEFGVPSRDASVRPRQIETGFGRSPYEISELAAMAPLEAAALVGEWRPDPAEFLVGPLELARTLEAAVVADPLRWMDQPIRIVTALREPIHIDHYLRGVTEAIKAGAAADPARLMDTVDFVLSAPWPATPMGRRDWDYEPDWSSCRDAAIGLLRSMADKSTGFADQDDHAWNIIRAGTVEPMDRTATVDDDPLTAAINHPATRALEAAISLLAYEIRTTGHPRQEILAHIERLLVVDGAPGARIRAIIASRLRYLVRAVPDFVSRVEPVLFGEAAPAGLAQLTVDLALHWDGPNSWLLERHRREVQDAVKRDVDNALEHLLVAYLWQCDGYTLDEVLAFLASNPGLTSEAGEALGRMLREGTPEAVQLGVRLWTATLESGPRRSLAGFGWFAEVDGVDNAEWSELTLRTMRASTSPIARPRGITKRLARMEPTPTGLAILDDLIRRPESPWAAHSAAEAALELLLRTEHLHDTVEYQRLRAALAERGMLD